ncbi:MAG: phosphatase PAP2 family protein [bacterium]
MLSRPRFRRLLFAAAPVALLLGYFILDRPVAHLAERIPTGWNPVFHSLSFLAGFPFVTGAGLVMLGFFFLYHPGRPRRSLTPLLYLPVTVLSASLSCELLKVLLARYRPGMLIDSGLHGFSFWKAGYWHNSFPSGHATVAFALFGALAFSRPRWRRWAFLAAGLVAASRVLLNLHYLSDIFAGALLGLGWALLYYRLFARFGLPVTPQEATNG